MGPKPVLSSDAKKCQQVFLAPLLGMGPKPVLSSDAKKCQQAFLALLLGMGPKPVLSSDTKKYQQPSGQSLAARGGSGASPVARPSEWSRPRPRGLPT
jgi:hypothetical protein